MAKPDYILYAALVMNETLTYEEAVALCEAHRNASYDQPVPINLDAGLEIAIAALSGVEDDAAIAAMFNGGDDNSGGVDGSTCSGCGCALDTEEPEGLADYEIDTALNLYLAFRSLVAETIL